MTKSPYRTGFTFIELLVALAILVSALAIAFSIFTATLRAWQRGTEAMTQLHHGDLVMDQLVQSLRSTVFFEESSEFYGFRYESRFSGPYPNDLISWVTSSSAFIPLDSAHVHGMHRIVVTVESAGDATYGVAVRAMPHLSDAEDEELDPWFVSTRVRGLRCRIFDSETDTWQETWDQTNSIPSLVEITLFMDPDEPSDPPIRIRRAINIPIAPAVTNRVDFTETS